MKYWLHPQAAQEHTRQVAYYEDAQAGLGQRYHAEFKTVVEQICANPDRFRVVDPPDIRRTPFQMFHFDVVYRVSDGAVQILAVAHHRRQPGYWAGRS